MNFPPLRDSASCAAQLQHRPAPAVLSEELRWELLPSQHSRRQKAFVGGKRLELTLFCSELEGVCLQEIGHLTAGPARPR